MKFTEYAILHAANKGKDTTALKQELKTTAPESYAADFGADKAMGKDRDNYDSSVRNAYKTRALTTQLNDLSNQSANLNRFTQGLSRGALGSSGAELMGQQRKSNETQLAEVNAQIAQTKADLEKQKRLEFDKAQANEKAKLESSISLLGVRKYTPEEYSSLATKTKDYDVALALDENRRNAEYETTLANGGVLTNSYLGYLTPTEKTVLANFVNLGQEEKAKKYIESMKYTLTAREREEVGKATAEGARQNPIAGGLINVVSSFGAPLSYLATLGGAAREAITGEYRPVDTNSSAFLGSQIDEDTREGINQAITDKLGEGTGANVANFLANTALSIGQFATKVPLGATGALAYMATGAAGQSSYDALNRGASSSQAALVGTASGIIEALAEKIPLDNLFKIAKGGGTSALKSIAKQAGIEAGEEAISEVANNFVDIAVMGDNSEFKQYVEFLKTSKGMSQAQAEAEAIKQFFVVNTAKSAAGGAISGGLMAGGANIVNSISTRANVNTAVKPQDNAGTQEVPSANTTLETHIMQENATQSVTEPIRQTATVETPIIAENKKQATEREILERANAYTDEYFKPLDEIESQDEIKQWQRIRNKMKEKFAAEQGGLNSEPQNAKYSIGNVVRVSDGTEGVISEVSFGEDGKPYYSVTDEKGNSSSAIKEFLLSDISAEKSRRDAFLATITNKAQKTKAETVLKDIKAQKFIDGLAQNPNSYSSINTTERAIKDGKGFSKNEYRIYSGENDGKSYYRASKPEYDYYEFVKGNATANTMPEGMGAATQGFNPYSALQNQYGTFEAKENPARVVDVPLKDAQGRNVSGTTQTVMEAEATPNALIPTLEQAVVDGDFSYDTYTDKRAQAQATRDIKYKGFQQSLTDWTSEVRSGKVNKRNTALGWTLYDNAANMVSDPNATEQQKDEAAKTAVAILTDMQAHERNAAQALQAQRMLKKMSPTYQLYALERSARSIANELSQKYKKEYDISIDKALKREYIEALNSKDAELQKAVEKKIQQNIASQIPSTFIDKWNAWRYLAMLGNPRTHIRNIVGNAGFMPVRMMKNVVAAGIEKGAQTVGLLNERSKSILTLSKGDRALMGVGWSDYNNVADQIQNGGKYDDARSAIDRERTIFSLKPVEAARTTNSKWLDKEDIWFSRPAYAESLASYLKANKIAAEQFNNMKPADKSKAQEYAIKEAQKATYRDHNAFSDFIARLGKNYQGDNKAMKAANVILEGVLPFKRTPANILSRVVEYSPIELVKSITYDAYQVKKGNMNATDMIDHLASGLVGTGLVGLGALLASQGLLSGGGSGDDKQDEFDKLQGAQNYAITIGDQTFTLDWLAPEAVPVFMGVEIFNKLSDESNGGSTLKDILEALGKITDPMLEMSMLQGVQDVIEGVKYSESPLVGAISNAAMGYLTQAAPTLFGQIERSFAEDTRQTTFTDKDSGIPTSVQYLLGKTLNKLPGEFGQMDYIDAWGRKTSTGGIGERSIMNFFSPAYKSEKNTTEVDTELQRLYDTGATSVLPQRAESTVTINGTKLNLSKEDFESYATTKGQTAFDTIQSIISSKAYQSMMDDEKAAVIGRAYAYADYKAKSQEFPQYKGDKWIATVDKAKSDLGMNTADYLQYAEKYGTATMSGDNIREAYRAGIKPDSYLSYYTKAQKLSSDKDENGKTIDGSKRGKILVLIDSMNISDKAKDYLYYANGYSAKTINEAPWR